MPDRNELELLSRMDIEKMEPGQLVDILEVKMDDSLPGPARTVAYLEQIKNPYCFRCGDIPVKVRFSDGGEELETLIKKHFLNLK